MLLAPDPDPVESVTRVEARRCRREVTQGCIRVVPPPDAPSLPMIHRIGPFGTPPTIGRSVESSCTFPVVAGIADPGAGTSPGYLLRAPEHGALHWLVHEHLETFLAEARVWCPLGFRTAQAANFSRNSAGVR